jgi:phosphinothricin acetyltransferase
MAVRRAAPDDLAAVVEIYNASIAGRRSTADLEPVSGEQRRAWMLDRDPARRPLWVLDGDDGDGVVGWVALDDFNPRAGYVGTAEVGCYLRPSCQGRGLGGALLAHAIAAAPECGIDRLVAKVFAHNEGSVRLFERAGFGRWGLLPGVTRLDGVVRDVLILGRAVP